MAPLETLGHGIPLFIRLAAERDIVKVILIDKVLVLQEIYTTCWWRAESARPYGNERSGVGAVEQLAAACGETQKIYGEVCSQQGDAAIVAGTGDSGAGTALELGGPPSAVWTLDFRHIRS
jgi:hypothetical protein